MYIDIKKILSKLDIPLKGVIHIGAHKGEELSIYKKMNIKNILLYEGNKKLIFYLKLKIFLYKFFFKNLKIILKNKIITNKSGNEIINITNNSQSSSILNLGLHKKLYPNIKKIDEMLVPCDTLNNEFKKHDINEFNFLNMDIQGAELLALQGATEILDRIDIVYTEVNLDEIYENCPLINELDDFLEKYNFSRYLTSTPESELWGDAIYVKKKFLLNDN